MKLSVKKEEKSSLECKIGLFENYKNAMVYLDKRLGTSINHSYDFSLEVLFGENLQRIEKEGIPWMDRNTSTV